MSHLGRLINFKRTLQINILIAFTALLITTVLVIVTYTYQQNSRAVLNLANDLINQVNLNVIERTSNFLAPAAQMAQTSAQLPNIDSESLVNNAELEQYGKEILNQHPQLSGFFIGNEQGDFIFTKRDVDGSVDVQVIDRSLNPPERTWTYRNLVGDVESVETTTDFTYDPRQRPWYGGAKESGNQFWTNIYIFFTDQKPGITSAYPILDENGRLSGVIGIDVALDELSQFLETQKVGENGVVFIINQNAELVAYPGIELAIQDGESFRPIHINELGIDWISQAYSEFEREGNGRFVFENNSERFIASFTPFPTGSGEPWQIGVVVPENDFIGSINRTNQITLIISLTILIFSIFAALIISRTISRPIVELTAETNKIKSFNLDSNVEVNSAIHEVQTLSESVTAMRNSLRAFQKYVPSELVRQLIHTGEEAQLGGTKRELTILFTDIIGFTTITEDMLPEKLMLQLSNYLGHLANHIMANNGTVDKFVGDGIMAFWGAPLENKHHAEQACRTALALAEAVEKLNNQWIVENKVTFPTRIGIHTGETLVGNMGSTDRMNYTVVGDSVNLTSRLEGANNVYGTQIIVSHDTYEKAVHQFHFRPLDVVTVKGKREFILLYELMGEIGHTPEQDILLADMFAEGFEAYVAQHWDEAQTIFEKILVDHPDDTPSHIYLTRCIALQEEPPGPGWQPITHLESYNRDL
ncbi:MAG: adenylate/guanylate cyclase domain-containing protein [Chloroflexota bacterium]